MSCICEMSMKNVKKKFWEINIEFVIIESIDEIIDKKRIIEFKVMICWV